MSHLRILCTRLLPAAPLLAVALLVQGCETPGQNRYAAVDVGRASVVEFGTVLAYRQVDIKGKNSGGGALAGGAAGGIAMSGVGNSGGNAAAVLGGVVAGAIAGAMIEQSMADRIGLEYVISLANGKTITIAQELQKGDRIFNAGERVMVQASGTYQRVLAADYVPVAPPTPRP